MIIIIIIIIIILIIIIIIIMKPGDSLNEVFFRKILDEKKKKIKLIDDFEMKN